jgi:hypothetical protein
MHERDDDAELPEGDDSSEFEDAPAEEEEGAPAEDDRPAAARRRTLERAGGGVGDRLAARGRSRVRKGLRGLDTGKVLGRSFSVWFANLIPFSVLSTIGFAPLIVYAIVLTLTPRESLTLEDLERYDQINLFLGNFLHFVVEAMVVYGVFVRLRGNRPSLIRCIGVGVQRLIPVLGLVLTMLVVIMAPFLPGGLLLLTGRSAAAALAIPLMLAGIIPFMVLRLGLVAAVPAMVVEGGSIIAALKRSWALSKGSKMTIWSILVVLGLLGWLVGAGIGVASVFGAQATRSLVIAIWPTLIMRVLMGGLDAAVAAVIYHDLRVAKEGIASAELAAIFD